VAAWLGLGVAVAVQASLESYDTAIAADAAGGLLPQARLLTGVVLDGTARVPFDFGTVPGDASFEFIVEGNPATSAYLAVGANVVSNLRYAQWSNTRELGFTQLGVADYRFSPAVASPTRATHVAYVWNGSTRTMRLYVSGALAGTTIGVDAGFAMPTGPGWLGANPGGTEAMVGTLHRVTVYNGRLAEEVILSHADAFGGVTRPPVIASFAATPDTVFVPATATLTWDVRQASAVFLNGQDVTGRSFLTVAPTVTTPYALVATNTAGRVEARLTVLVNPAPIIRRFAVNRSYATSNETVTFDWDVLHGQKFAIAPGVGDVTALTVAGVGSVHLVAPISADYVLTARNAFGATSATVAIHRVEPASHPVISEFMADDEATLPDEDGEHSGWIEIFNPTASTVNLAGWTLTDRPDQPGLWTFPALELRPGACCVVFASGKDRTRLGAPLHTNFRLNNAGEFLALIGPSPGQLHAFAPAFPPQRPDIAYGLLGGDPGLVRYLGVPTPGARNDETPPSPMPVEVSVPGRLFAQSFTVTLSAPDPEAEIRFTVDGSRPGLTNGARYLDPIPIDTTTHLRAVAVVGGRVSAIRGASYIRLAPDLVAYTSTLPILVIDNFGVGTIPQKGWNGSGAGIRQVARQTAAWVALDRTNGIAAMTQQPRHVDLVGIRGRGAYSTEWRQKPYSVEGTDEEGQEAEISPLGMPAHADWVLYYPDPDSSRDPSLLFNTFAYELSRNLGHYAVRFRWVEAFVNEDGGALQLADRRGVYVLLEKVARGRDRLDFQRLAADGSTGGWLLNINRMDPEPETGWPAPNGATEPWFFHTAGPNRIVETLPNTSYGDVPGDDQPQQWNGYLNFENPNGHAITLPQRGAIERWFKEFEDTLYNDARWRDPTNGYRRYLDTFDFADYFLLNTLTRNGDGLLISMFPWKGDDGRLRIGPAWDYNWSSYYISGGASGGLLHRSEQLWYPRLFADPDFMQFYIDRWWDARRGAASHDALAAIIDRQAAEIGPDKALLNGMPDAAEWTRRLAQMRTWLQQRAAWIDSQYLRPPTFSRDGGTVSDGLRLEIAATTGVVYVTIDGTDPRVPGGAVSPAAKAYTGPIILHPSMTVRARCRSGVDWSGPTTATFALDQDLSSLVVTEALYHPLAAGGWPEDDLEFLELRNTGLKTLQLDGLRFDAGIGFTFTNGTRLDPGHFFVLARNPTALAGQDPGAVANGVYTGKLDNAGETVRLVTSSGTLVFEWTYDDRSPWPTGADGTGLSLQQSVLETPPGDPNDPAHWFAALPTPGADGSPDRDGDGLPDDWELACGLDPRDPSDRDEDRDGDGMTNRAEYVAGTHPRDASNVLRIDSVGFEPGVGSQLTFRAVANRSYRLECCDALVPGVWSVVGDVASVTTDSFVSVRDASFQPQRFYRLVIAP
jgi:hypothetical protein